MALRIESRASPCAGVRETASPTSDGEILSQGLRRDSSARI